MAAFSYSSPSRASDVPLDIRILDRIQQVGLLLILALFMYVTTTTSAAGSPTQCVDPALATSAPYLFLGKDTGRHHERHYLQIWRNLPGGRGVYSRGHAHHPRQVGAAIHRSLGAGKAPSRRQEDYRSPLRLAQPGAPRAGRVGAREHHPDPIRRTRAGTRSRVRRLGRSEIAANVNRYPDRITWPRAASISMGC